VLIRGETVEDHGAIAQVNRAAFGGDEESRLVELLRTDALIIASLVAAGETGQVVGHILFSPVTIVTATSERRVASLAPMAVAPAVQRRGIGSLLVESGVRACAQAGYDAVIVVGHPDYYPRFGFSPELVAGLLNPFVAGKAFMGLELVRGALSDLGQGTVVYPRAFDQIS
jgi:putative acetyltransferase